MTITAGSIPFTFSIPNTDMTPMRRPPLKDRLKKSFPTMKSRWKTTTPRLRTFRFRYILRRSAQFLLFCSSPAARTLNRCCSSSPSALPLCWTSAQTSFSERFRMSASVLRRCCSLRCRWTIPSFWWTAIGRSWKKPTTVRRQWQTPCAPPSVRSRAAP